MDGPPPDRPAPRTGWRGVPGPLRVAIVVVPGLVALTLAAFVAWVVFGPTPTESFDAEIARLRAAGYATTYAELAVPPPPADENGMALLEEALAEVKELAGDPKSWTVPGPWREDCSPGWPQRVPPSELAEARELLGRLAPAYAKLDAAADRPRLAWTPVAGADGFPKWEPMSQLQLAQRLLTFRAEASTDPADRLRAVVTAARLGSRTDTYGSIEWMVRRAILVGAANVLRPMVEDGTVSASDARATMDAELRADVLPSLAEAARCDLVAQAEVFGLLLHGTDLVTSDGTRLQARKAMRREMTVSNLLFGGPVGRLRSLRALAEIPAGTLSETLRRVREIDEASDRLNRDATFLYPGLAERDGRADAVLRLARVALAVAERHETTGAWPTSLDAVLDAFPEGLPLDPYTDAPFRYEVGDDVVRIASAGRLPEDPETSAAGEEADPDETPRALGLVWEFPR